MPHLLKRRLLTGLFVLMSVLLTSCATSNKVAQDYKPETNFSTYKTFSWHNFSSDVQNSNQLAIQAEIEKRLNQQGFRLIAEPELPDFILDLNIVKHAASRSATGLGISIGLPIGRHGAIGLGTSKLLGNDATLTALIILDITAQATHEVIWRGTADDVSLNDFTLRNQAKLNATLGNLILQFPPKAKN